MILMKTFLNFYVFEYINIFYYLLCISTKNQIVKKFLFIITYFCLLSVLVAACWLSLVAQAGTTL